jgi:fructose/tagatose bisphosphate aldolase
MSQAQNIEANKILLAEKKKDGCEDCGFNAHPAALDLDHIDPSTKHVTKTGRRQSPSSMITYPVELFSAELAKCRVLCKNCHAIHTHMQNKMRKENGEKLARGSGYVRKMSEPSVRIAA